MRFLRKKREKNILLTNISSYKNRSKSRTRCYKASPRTSFRNAKCWWKSRSLTFHSLEDKIVKKYFKEVCSIDDKIKGLPNIPKEYLPDFKLVVNKAIIPTDKELENNNRARSAKLRIIERVK